MSTTNAFSQMLAHAKQVAAACQSEADALAKLPPDRRTEVDKQLAAGEPFGVLFLENPSVSVGVMSPTAATTCSFNPWDGCRADID